MRAVGVQHFMEWLCPFADAKRVAFAARASLRATAIVTRPSVTIRRAKITLRVSGRGGARAALIP
jgi:hypothetical protein